MKRRYNRRLLDLVVSASDVSVRNRAVAAATPIAAPANSAAATVGAQRPTADVSTGGGPAQSGPCGAPWVAVMGAARAAASIDMSWRGALTAAVTTPRKARVASFSGHTMAVESGPTKNVGRRLSVDDSWAAIKSNASGRPADEAHMVVGPTAVRGADGRSAQYAVLPAADEAPRRVDGGVAGRLAYPLAISPGAAAAVEAPAVDPVTTAVEATGLPRLTSGPDSGMDGRLRRAGRRAPCKGMSGTGTHLPVAAAGPGSFGCPSDLPAALNSRSTARRRSRAHVPPAVIRGIREGVGDHLQVASEIALQEWSAVEPSTIAHCWRKATILPNAVAMTSLPRTASAVHHLAHWALT